MKKLPLAFAISPLILLTACGSSDKSSTPTDSSDVLTGQFIDSPVANIAYKTATQSGFTNTNGEFKYKVGETVTFSIGDLDLPPATAGAIVTPFTLAGTTDSSDTSVANISRLLQSLDADGDTSNGITIDNQAHTTAKDLIGIDFSSDSFDNLVANLVADSGSVTTGLISVQEAIDHLQDSINDSNAIITTQLLSGNTFTASVDDSNIEKLTFNDNGTGSIKFSPNANNDFDQNDVNTITSWSVIAGVLTFREVSDSGDSYWNFAITPTSISNDVISFKITVSGIEDNKAVSFSSTGTMELHSDESEELVIPEVLSSSWLAGKTLYDVWHGIEDNIEGVDGRVASITFSEDGSSAHWLGVYESNIDASASYTVDANGGLYFGDDQGNRFTINACGGSNESFLEIVYTENGELNNIDRFYFSEAAAVAYAQTLTEMIPQTTCANSDPEPELSIPDSFTSSWLAGQTLYDVWHGIEDNIEGVDGRVASITFSEDGSSAHWLGVYESNVDASASYTVDANGGLYFGDDQGNRFTINACGGSNQSYLEIVYTENGELNNIDRFYFSEAAAITYAQTLTEMIPQTTCANSEPESTVEITQDFLLRKGGDWFIIDGDLEVEKFSFLSNGTGTIKFKPANFNDFDDNDVNNLSSWQLTNGVLSFREVSDDQQSFWDWEITATDISNDDIISFDYTVNGQEDGQAVSDSGSAKMEE